MHLLDTHALIWANISPERLSPAVREAIESRTVRVSLVSLWELILKKRRAGTAVPDPLFWWDLYVTRAAVEVVPIRTAHIAQLDALPELHRDPFDRMLVAQARAEKLRLITGDTMLARYDVEIVW
jgi:PIN domain nuclease of toxin-antitoxin system